MERGELYSLIIRYFLLALFGTFNLAIFYLIFSPLTVYPSYFFISKIFENSILISTDPYAILFKGYIAKIIPACIAGSAYYLLLILNLTTPMQLKRRIYSLLFLFSSFLIINIARIVLFATLVPIGFEYFDVTHELTWYLGSTIMVVFIWFVNVLIFKISAIPVYSDLKSIYSDIK